MCIFKNQEKIKQDNIFSVMTKSLDTSRLYFKWHYIILNGTEETFSGGDLKVSDDFFDNITSYSTTFYIMAGDEKDVILSNGMVDMTGDTVNISGDLGQISGDSAIRRIKTSSHIPRHFFAISKWGSRKFFDTALCSGRDATGQEKGAGATPEPEMAGAHFLHSFR